MLHSLHSFITLLFVSVASVQSLEFSIIQNDLYKDRKTFNNAEKYCKKNFVEGRLALLTSIDAANQVKKLVKRKSAKFSRFYWVGLHKKNGVYTWLDGSTDFSNTPPLDPFQQKSKGKCVLASAITANTASRNVKFRQPNFFLKTSSCDEHNDFICQHKGRRNSSNVRRSIRDLSNMAKKDDISRAKGAILSTKFLMVLIFLSSLFMTVFLCGLLEQFLKPKPTPAQLAKKPVVPPKLPGAPRPPASPKPELPKLETKTDGADVNLASVAEDKSGDTQQFFEEGEIYN